MVYISITKLTLSSIFKLFNFIKYASRANLQAAKSEGNISIATKNQYFKHFWTLTVWESKDHMSKYVRSGDHRKAILTAPLLASEICIYGYESDNVPGWKEAMEILKQNDTSKKIKYLKK